MASPDNTHLGKIRADGTLGLNRHRLNFTEPEESVADDFGAAAAATLTNHGLVEAAANAILLNAGQDQAPSGQRSDFSSSDPKTMIDEMHQNVVDGYIGRMTVPGGATVKVSELTSRTTLAIMPDGAYRRSSNGDFIEVNGAVLYLPLKGSKDSDYTAATIDHGKQRIKIVVNRARKAKKERDARTLFQSLQPSDLRTENGVDLRQWVAGDDVDSDALVREELEGARIGFRGHQAGIPTDLQTWNAGEDVDLDRAVRDELDSYRDRFWN